MDPTSDLVNAVDELIAAIQRSHEPSDSTDWLHHQRGELVAATSPESIDDLVVSLLERLPDLYDQIVVEEGDHSLRAAFANVATHLRKAKEDESGEVFNGTAGPMPAVQDGPIGTVPEDGSMHFAPVALREPSKTTKGAKAKEKAATAPAPAPAPDLNLATMKQKPSVAEEVPEESDIPETIDLKPTVIVPGDEEDRENGLMSSVSGVAGLVLLFVSIVRIRTLDPFVCSSSVASIALWLGIYGSLAFGTLTVLMRTIEIQRARKLGQKISFAGHAIQLLGIIEMASFALVIIMYNSRHCIL